MILDLHCHSIKSDDGRAKVPNYCRWIRARNIPIDGFVLTEHRQYDGESDYSALAREFGLTILKGSEVETEYGHVLLFGVTGALTRAIDFTNINLPLAQVIEVAERHGAVPVPCHPGRKRVGMFSHIDEYGVPEGVRIVEIYNGGSRDREDEFAQRMTRELGYLGIGGSDSHIVSHIGRCATRFPADVKNASELADALRAEQFEALDFDPRRRAATRAAASGTGVGTEAGAEAGSGAEAEAGAGAGARAGAKAGAGAKAEAGAGAKAGDGAGVGNRE